jgi:hypothetical protein
MKMIKLITGGKGTGKTKKMIGMANDLAERGKGNVVFINENHRQMYALKHSVRLIGLDEYNIKNLEEGFIGFLCGIISSDHDIEGIFIDGLLNIAAINILSLPNIVQKLKDISQKFNVQIVASINCAVNELPEELRAYHIA